MRHPGFARLIDVTEEGVARFAASWTYVSTGHTSDK
jgi:hypothetical protein